MDEEGSLWHPHLYSWKCFDPVVPLHLHLPAANGQHLQAANFRWIALHGSSSHGRDADLGYLRQPPYRSFDLSDPIHHCATHDERKTPLPACGACSLHVKFSVSSCRSLPMGASDFS